MKFCRTLKALVAAVTLGACTLGSAIAADAGSDLSGQLANLARRFDELSFATNGKRERRDGFEDLLAQADALVSSHPDSVEALTWKGIVLSTYAGEVSMFSAMKYANAARETLHMAESKDSAAASSDVYTSLGALYAHVPGGMVGFGDSELAADYLRRALAISPESLDANYFFAELLISEGKDDEAKRVLTQGLDVPRVAARPIFDDARRAQMRSMLSEL